MGTEVGDPLCDGADALLDCYNHHGLCYNHHGLQVSVLLHGIEGFGLRQRVQTQRLLTLSEDLPLVSVAVDTRARIERALPEVVGLSSHGLVTLERARLLVGRVRGVRFPDRQTLGEETKLTIYLGRRERAAIASGSGGGPAFLAVVELLRRHGIAGATVLPGVGPGTVGDGLGRLRQVRRDRAVGQPWSGHHHRDIAWSRADGQRHRGANALTGLSTWAE